MPERRTHETPSGTVVYWTSRSISANAPWLVFIPGLTADHTLFAPQLEHFAASANCLVWDAPAHGSSRPFALDFTMDSLATLLHDILAREGADRPVLVGQSLGGYIAQAYLDLYPGEVAGFVSIDSCPLQRSYYAGWELWALKHTRLMYLSIPWKLLVRWGSTGCAVTQAARDHMASMALSYEKRAYCELAAHGYRMLAEAVEADRPYIIDCPALLICGERDQAGSAKSYNRRWVERTGLTMVWIPNCGHNAPVDAPDAVNRALEGFLAELGCLNQRG